jgi:hypothetical protein
MFEDDPFGNDLTQLLFGNGQNQQPQALQPMSGDMPQTSMINTMLGAAPQPVQSQQPSFPSQQSDEGGGMAITGWKPHKRTTLGTIADVALSFLTGHEITPFRDKKGRENIQEAMEGFTSDPLQTIQRIARIPGMEGKALDLYEKYVDNNRMQQSVDRQNQVLGQRNDDYMYNQVAGMMGAVRPDGSNWKPMRDLAIKRAAARGVDVSSIIPEEYDQDSIDFIRYGSVKPKDQMKMEETNRHNTTREGQMQQGLDERASHNDVMEGISEGRLGETRRHNNVTEGQGQTRINNSKNAKPRVVNTPNGPMELSPSGITGKIGNTIWQKTGPGQWKRIK